MFEVIVSGRFGSLCGSFKYRNLAKQIEDIIACCSRVPIVAALCQHV